MRRTTRNGWIVLLMAGLFGCTSAKPGEDRADAGKDAATASDAGADAGPVDGSRDVGTNDAGHLDSGTEDASSTDAVSQDAVSQDATTQDATTQDATTLDATTLDATTLDATTLDGATSDTGTTIDAGTPDAGCSQTLCSGDCVDLQTSPDHCGRCDHACGGGQCNFGVCQPFNWFEQLNVRPTKLVHDYTTQTMFWIDERTTGAILGKEMTQGSTTFAVATNQKKAQALAVDSVNVFWTTDENGFGGGVVRYRDKALQNPPVQVTQSNQTSPTGLAVENGIVFWNDNSPLYIRAHRTSPPFDYNLRSTSGSGFVNLVVADGTHVYWLDANSNIFRTTQDLPVSPAPTQVVANTGGEAGAVAQNSRHLYWGEDITALNRNGTIFRVDKSLLNTEVVVQQADPQDNRRAVGGLWVQQTYVYYTTQSIGGHTGDVFRAPTQANATPELLAARGTAALEGIVVVGNFVYWAETVFRSTSDFTGYIKALRLP